MLAKVDVEVLRSRVITMSVVVSMKDGARWRKG